MYSKLNLKVYGVHDQNDLKIIEENLKSQDGLKNIKVIQLKSYLEIKLDVEENKINKQQIIDVIKLSGDFTVEEQNEFKTTKIETLPPVLNSVQTNSVSQDNTSRTYFIWGLLVGFSVVSLLVNVQLGYSLSKDSKRVDLSLNNQLGNQVAKNTVPEVPSVPVPVEPVGQVQEFKITKNDNVRGNFDAPITLVEYSDFECPFCERIYPTFKKLLSQYPDKVRLVYKHFPLSFHPNAQKASEASECAGEQGKFWEYHDTLFDNQQNGFSTANFKQWAEDLGLNSSKFDDCLDTGKYASKVQADEVDGQSRGVNGTPATFINGQLVSGAVPYESFKSIIDQLINNN